MVDVFAAGSITLHVSYAFSPIDEPLLDRLLVWAQDLEPALYGKIAEVPSLYSGRGAARIAANRNSKNHCDAKNFPEDPFHTN